MLISFLALICVTTLSSCDKIEIIGPRDEPPVHYRNDKPRTPIEVGTIRCYINDRYVILREPMSLTEPVDTFSNCFLYGRCNGGESKQINMIRRNDEYTVLLFINGVSPDSLPAGPPVKQVFGRSAEIQVSSRGSYAGASPGFWYMNHFYGNNVIITDNTDDVLTGTFQGSLAASQAGTGMWVSDGEFKIKIIRKDMSCDP